MSHSKNPAVLGIDFGASKIVSAFYDVINDKCDIILDNEEARHTTSCLAFTKDERLFSKAAEYQGHNNPENTLFGRDIKRIIGYNYNEVIDNIDRKNTFINFEKCDDNNFTLSVKYRNKCMRVHPEHFFAMLLSRLKENAENRLNRTVTQAVITVPSMFTTFQRHAMINACSAAGLELKGLINNTTATAVRYAVEKSADEPKNILIFDMGATSLDIGIFKINKSNVETLASNGSLKIGGECFTKCLFKHFEYDFQTRNECDISRDKQKLSRLREGCEEIKIFLSASSTASHTIETFHEGKPYELKLNREFFDNICHSLYDKIKIIVDETLKTSKLDKKDIHEFIIVGGGGRIPKIEAILRESFGNRSLSKVMNPDESVAIGAAYYGSKQNDSMMVQEIISTELFIKLLDSLVIFVKKGSKLPFKNEISLKKNSVWFSNTDIFQDDRNLYTIKEIDRACKCIDFVTEVDINGLVYFEALYELDSQVLSEVYYDHKVLHKSKIEEMKELDKILEEQEKQRKKLLQSVNNLEKLCFTYNRKVTSGELSEVLSDDEKKSVVEVCEKILDWVSTKKYPTNDELINKREILDEKCSEVIEKANNKLMQQKKEERAKNHFIKEEYEEAIQIYNELIQESKNCPKILSRIYHFYRGKSYYFSSEFRKAIIDFDYILNDHYFDKKMILECRYFRAQCYFTLNEHSKCKEETESLLNESDIIEDDRKAVFLLNFKVTLALVDQFVSSKQASYAINLLNLLLIRKETNDLRETQKNLLGQLYYKLAKCRHELGNNEEALKDLEEAVPLMDEYHEIDKLKALCYFQLNNFNAAENFAKKYLEFKSDDSEINKINAEIQAKRKKEKYETDLKLYDEAFQTQEFKDAMKISKNLRKNYSPLDEKIIDKLLRGDIQANYHLKKYHDGIIDCTILISKNEKDIDALEWRIKHNLCKENFKQVKKDCETILSVSPDNQFVKNLYQDLQNKDKPWYGKGIVKELVNYFTRIFSAGEGTSPSANRSPNYDDTNSDVEVPKDVKTYKSDNYSANQQNQPSVDQHNADSNSHNSDEKKSKPGSSKTTCV